jgi:potassium-dependent mechanosensitive channel
MLFSVFYDRIDHQNGTLLRLFFKFSPELYPDKRNPPMTIRRILAVWCLLFLFAGRAGGQESTGAPPLDPTIDLKASLADALETAEDRRDRLAAELAAFRRESRALAGELGAYRVQLSTYGNLAVMPEVDPEILMEALADLRHSRVAVQETLDRLLPRREELAEMRRQTASQLDLNRSQVTELKKMPPAAGGNGWIEKLAALTRVQKDILDLIEKLDPLYTEAISGFETTAAGLSALEPTLAAARDEARRTAVFSRGENPVSKLNPAGLAAEAERLGSFIQRLDDPDFWRRQSAAVLDHEAGSVLTAVVLGLGLFLALLRLRAALGRVAAHVDGAHRPWRAALWIMLRRNVVPLGMLAFFTFNTAAPLEPDPRTVVGAVIAFLWVWLPGRWVRCFFALPLSDRLVFQWPLLAVSARRLVDLSRLYAAAHIFFTWSLGAASMMEALARLTLEVVLVVWLVVFWRHWRKHSAAGGPIEPRGWRLQAAIAFSYVFVLTAPVLDLAGYGALALYWYAGWGLTLATVIWAALLGQTLREMDAPVVTETGTGTPTRGPLQWALLRLAWLLWGAAFLASLALAWGGSQSLVSGLGQVLSYPIVIGDATFHLKGGLIALLVLFFTHLAARLWRQALMGRILARSGMTHGARDSVVTISVYLIWTVGILIALHVFGISTTSLMVAFGALGIGLGFGLQNIFNNFISGLILLFERPIQVGDDIEINGIWARVLQINVRATVVQTYDGAALIIPNSEFISNAVTNWSHRDPYLRRQIAVGVAYGSDTELVRRTLLEAAANTALVLTQPQPDVLFTDFGASTLDFRLRVWTTLDDMLRADTALRFEIDRLFRQRGIEIAFPQTDVHVRSLPAGPGAEQVASTRRQGDGVEADDGD